MKKLVVFSPLFLLLFLFGISCGEDLGPRVEELEDEVASLQSQAQTLQSDKAQLETANAQLEQENTSLQETVGPPPSFLDRLFPPQAPFPVLLVEMFALASPFEGLAIDLTQGDFENLAADFQVFRAQYEKLRNEVIPEWEELLPLEPVDALETALASQDPAQIGPALGGVGAVCGQCHQAYQLKVQLKYHWPDFNQVMLTDPVSGESVPWIAFMMNMVQAFDGIGHDLSQGQMDRSLESYQNFTSYFDTLRQGCSACHATPREYFVDARAQADVDALGQAIQATTPDPEAISGLLQQIGNDTCLSCHLVHFPAAKTKAGWELMEIME